MTGIEDFTNLAVLNCNYNNISSLDLSNNSSLTSLKIKFNQLYYLNVNNSNNTNISLFITVGNTNLNCIIVDNVSYSTNNWTNIDPWTNFCSPFTYVPDAVFESYLENNGMGDGINGNNQVYTSNIAGVQSLYVNTLGISDLTGIEDFSSLEFLNCKHNQISYLNLSSNTNLNEIIASGNSNLIEIDLRNGNNTSMNNFSVNNCPALNCILVDSVSYFQYSFLYIPIFLQLSVVKYLDVLILLLVILIL